MTDTGEREGARDEEGWIPVRLEPNKRARHAQFILTIELLIMMFSVF